jgi:hypothetical protein
MFKAFILILLVCTPAFAAEGLDSLNDDALMNELASRGLDTLLERAFDVDQIPPSERDGRRTLLALSRLGDPNSHLSIAQRQKLVNDIVAGIENALPSINDPNLLMRQAFVLITQGVERDVNTLEYWGENTHTQAELRPIVQTVIKILDRCAQLAKSQSDDIANSITSPNSPAVAKYEQLDRLAATALYTKSMVAYYLAISMDWADPQRYAVAGEAIDYLKQFDVPQNPDRCVVRNRMAKLAMAKADFDTARQLFTSVINDNGTPRPTIPQQYEARYFTAVTELLAKNPSAAQQDLDDLLIWQQQNLPADKTARDGAEAAAAMLKYRLLFLQADLAKTDDEKKHLGDQAVTALMDLLAKRPDLSAVIYSQLVPNLEQQIDVSKAQPLVLRALISKGEQETKKQADEPVDTTVLERAIDAANEVVRRGTQSGIDQPTIDASQMLIPFFLKKLDRRIEAAVTFVDFAEKFKQINLSAATLALNNAQSLIGQLRADADTRDDPKVTTVYLRFLPLAIGDPFDRKEFAFEYARRMQVNGNSAGAAKYFQIVPASDKRFMEARFLELVAMKQQIEDAPADSPERSQTLSRIQTVAEQVQTQAKQRMNVDRAAAQSMLLRTSLLAADVARREQNDPQRAVQWLSGFENAAAGLPDSQSLIDEAMYIRVQSYMAEGKNDEATGELLQLLNKSEGGQGAQIVYNLLEKLNADFDRAQQAGDRKEMKLLAKNRAQLSGFLVQWAAGNKDENIRKFTYRYRVFDAETQRRAAELEDDSNAKTADLKLALQRYQALQSSENVQLYKDSLDAQAAAESDLYDPQVALGIALVSYDLGDFQSAADGLSKLLSQRKLGAAVINASENGQEKSVDNDRYWEAVFKLIRSNVKLGSNLDQAKSYLKTQYITWGDRVGGKKWKGQFDALRAELIPDFKI